MQVREKKEQNKSRQRFWEMAGSKMGQITGVHDMLCHVHRLPHMCSNAASKSIGTAASTMSVPVLCSIA